MYLPRTRRAALVAGLLSLLVALAGFSTAAPAGAAVGDGSPSDPNISFVGRWDTRNANAYVPGFAGAYFQTGFTGTTVALRQRNAIDLYYSIDGADWRYIQNVRGVVGLTPQRLAAGNHTLRVSYRVVAGSYTGDAVFQGLTLDSGARTLPWPRPARLLEFIGDSITVGTTSSRNALTAYGWLIGEQLGAAHTQIAEGGACLVSAADGCTGMADRFGRVSAVANSAAWDFSRYKADAVVINMGTNDVGHSVSTTTFQATYTELLRTVRARYPDAAIFALQTFRNRFTPQTQAAVQTVTAAGDRNTWFVPTDGWLSSSDLSDNVHPNDAGHRTIAARLAPIISARLTTTPTTPAPTTPAATTPAVPTTAPATTVPATTAPATTQPQPAGGCAVTYRVTNEWSGGRQVDVTVRNTGTAALTGWTLAWTMPADQRISQSWNAVTEQTGAGVRATNASYNAQIPAGGSVSFGFTATGTATATPATFTLNGAACQVA